MARKSTATSASRFTRSSVVALALCCAWLLTAVGSAPAHLSSDTAGHTTVEQTIVGGDPAEGFQTLALGPGEQYAVRDELASPQGGRADRRRSLAYFGQITDFQLADEESPAREERTDSEPFRRGLGSSGYRPQEALAAQTIELTIRQLNRFVRSPVRQGNGRRARMLNAVMTGDLADNMQRNETEWVLRLLEGGTLDPNSGTTDFSGTHCQGLPPSAVADGEHPERYTGVQDYDDYAADNPLYYDPDHPIGAYSEWPSYPGLLDRAQHPFPAAGLKVPSYVAFGNHDGLYQGTVSAFPPIVSTGATFEQPATDCLKPVYPLSDQDAAGAVPAPDYLAGVFASDPSKVMLVPPDSNRQFVDHEQFKAIFDPSSPGSTATQQDAHGFGYVDPVELAASAGYAAYYSFSPAPGIRYVVLDTLASAGNLASPNREGEVGGGERGNIDNPQFEWLGRELDEAERRGELVIAFGHHARTSLGQDTPDEANPCLGVPDEHGHDLNPSCDGDPRASTPIHNGGELIELFLEHPNAIAYVGGHSHENEISPYCEGSDPDAPLSPPCEPGSSGLWEIKSPATADWPPQHRAIEVMDNRDGTLSIFATNLDHAGPTGIPESGTPAEGFGKAILAAIGRVLTYNDPGEIANHEGAVGTPEDRNVELLIADPRERTVRPLPCATKKGKAKRRCKRARTRRR